MKSFIAALVLFYFGAFAFAQTDQKTSSGTKTQVTVSPPKQVHNIAKLKHAYHPKITLQHALALEEKYIETEKIDTSSYYLTEARLIMFGSDKKKVPVWFFHWSNESGSLGNYVNIIVFIDTGEIRRLTTM